MNMNQIDTSYKRPKHRLTPESNGNDQLLYFTSPSLTADGRNLVFISDRTGHPNLFTRDLLTGEERQLTDNAEGFLKSYIYFEIQISSAFLTCIIKNSKHKATTNPYDEYSGIGLENIKKSLNLLYEQDYSLNISDKEHDFEVNLIIPV